MKLVLASSSKQRQDILDIIDDLKSTLEFGTGLGIAAPQIGVNKRVMCFLRK